MICPPLTDPSPHLLICNVPSSIYSPSSPFQLLNQSESGGLRRKADAIPELDHFEQAKRAKLTALAPSDASKPSYYQKIQGNASQKILDDRPLADVDVPPAPLLYSGFGHFVDIYNGCDDVPYLSDIDLPTSCEPDILH